MMYSISRYYSCFSISSRKYRSALIGDNYEDFDESSATMRSSLVSNAEGRVTMKEIRHKLHEARNIRMRKTAERLSGIGPQSRNTIGAIGSGGVFEMTAPQTMNRIVSPVNSSGSNTTGSERQRSVSFSAATKSPMFK